MIDELSKKHFVVPFNLRDMGNGGFFFRYVNSHNSDAIQGILLLTRLFEFGIHGRYSSYKTATFALVHSLLPCSRRYISDL